MYFFFFNQTHTKYVVICYAHHLTWNKVSSQRQSFGTNLDFMSYLDEPKMFCFANVYQ